MASEVRKRVRNGDCKEVLYYILLHDGTAEPLGVSPPEAVAYLLELHETEPVPFTHIHRQ